MTPKLTVSIVSHGQGELIQALLNDLRPLIGQIEVIVTLNIPESERFLADIDTLVLIRNTYPKGFGANHNQAFLRCSSDFFAVLNPDIRLTTNVFHTLMETARIPSVAVCAPVVLAPNGTIEDSARKYPTLNRIINRVARRLSQRRLDADYSITIDGTPLEVDWVAGMCMFFRSSCFREIGGFDEAYFMYLEDADICRRLKAAGWKVLVNQKTAITHDARRATFKSIRHLRWHLNSLGRFLVRYGIIEPLLWWRSPS